MVAPAGFILIVDDNQTNIKSLFDLLRDEGFRVLVAKNGENAIAQLKEFKPDLILLDIMMPGIDGFETCRRLKADPDTQSIPVVFMTALSDAVDKVKGLQLGAVDYITKPFQHDEVLARVHLHLKLYRLTRELRELNYQLEQRVDERTSELSAALQQLQDAQLQIVQNEKMSALGELIAGVAHEINNPINFLRGNLKYVQDYMDGLFQLIHLYQQEYPEPSPVIQSTQRELDLDYIQDDFPKVLASMQEGVKRLSSISTGLRVFSRADAERTVAFDLHEGLESALLILKHRFRTNDQRSEIQVVKSYGHLPLIEGYPGPLNQVFMNIIANAIDAIDEAVAHRRGEERSRDEAIFIETDWLDPDETVVVRIRDTGMGMSDEVKARVFDYQFTTKPVGKGTGLGLAIARQIVVEKHHGQITVNSHPDGGAEFVITLPLRL